MFFLVFVLVSMSTELFGSRKAPDLGCTGAYMKNPCKRQCVFNSSPKNGASFVTPHYLSLMGGELGGIVIRALHSRHSGF